LVLGTGGAAQAVIFTLNKLGIEYLSVSRREQKNAITYAAITELMNEYTAIINSTPLGTFPKFMIVLQLPMSI
jgi:shikimate dehydrogenase